MEPIVDVPRVTVPYLPISELQLRECKTLPESLRKGYVNVEEYKDNKDEGRTDNRKEVPTFGTTRRNCEKGEKTSAWGRNEMEAAKRWNFGIEQAVGRSILPEPTTSRAAEPQQLPENENTRSNPNNDSIMSMAEGGDTLQAATAAQNSETGGTTQPTESDFTDFNNSIQAACRHFKHKPDPWTWRLPIAEKLIQSLYFALYNGRFEMEGRGSYLFQLLKRHSDGYMEKIILHLDSRNLFGKGRPISHVFMDLIACITFLRDEAGEVKKRKPVEVQQEGAQNPPTPPVAGISATAEDVEESGTQSEQSSRFWTQREKFWNDKICKVLPESEKQDWNLKSQNWTKFSEDLKPQMSCLFEEVRNLLLLDPRNYFTAPASPKGRGGNYQTCRLRLCCGTAKKEDQIRVPQFRAWARDPSFRTSRFIQSTVPHTFRGELYESAGLKPGDLNPKDSPKANLADFQAEFILSGPFKIVTTTDPSLHLRFDEKDFRRPTLQVLDSHTITLLALLDLTGFTKQIEAPTFLNELLLSHSLFFGRSLPSNGIMARIVRLVKCSRTPEECPVEGINMKLVHDYQDTWSEDISAVHINDFPIYGTRLQTIHQRMTDWRSLRLWHSFWYRPYRDSLPVYAFRFGILLAGVTLTTLALTISWHRPTSDAKSPQTTAAASILLNEVGVGTTWNISSG